MLRINFLGTQTPQVLEVLHLKLFLPARRMHCSVSKTLSFRVKAPASPPW